MATFHLHTVELDDTTYIRVDAPVYKDGIVGDIGAAIGPGGSYHGIPYERLLEAAEGDGEIEIDLTSST
jgi:hypothetical protein